MPVPKGVAKSKGTSVLTAGSSRPIIPQGDYVVVCHSTRLVQSFGKERKLVVCFRIVEGAYAGAELSMFCSYPKGRITASRKLYTQWSLAIGRKPNKNERFSHKVFRDKMYLVSSRKVRRRFKDKTPMADYLSYSVVDTIKETLTGTPPSNH